MNLTPSRFFFHFSLWWWRFLQSSRPSTRNVLLFSSYGTKSGGSQRSLSHNSPANKTAQRTGWFSRVSNSHIYAQDSAAILLSSYRAHGGRSISRGRHAVGELTGSSSRPSLGYQNLSAVIIIISSTILLNTRLL